MAREYFQHRKALRTIHPRYKYDCPTNCELEGYNPNRLRSCEDCPLLELEEVFRNKAEQQFKLRIFRNKYRFPEVLKTFYTIMGLMDLDKREVSMRNSYLLNILNSEKNFAEEKDDWNRQQKEEAG